MRNSLLKNTIVALLALISIVLSFTPYYGFGYALFTFLVAARLHILVSFSTYFSRVVLAGLLLYISVMIAGFVALPFKTEVHPLMSIVCMAIVTGIIIGIRGGVDSSKNPIISKGDLYSLGLALLGPVIMLASYSVSAPGILRIANEGWDNGSHLNMIQDGEKFNRYLYGPTDELKDLGVKNTGAYPHGWHFASANITGGFAKDAFDPKNAIHAMYLYVALLLGWTVVATFCFIKVSWFVANKFLKRRIRGMYEFTAFTLINILITSIVLWGSLVSGFSNYTALIAYICILIACILEFELSSNRQSLVKASTFFALGGVLCWFLPAPSILFMAFVLAFILFKHRQKGLIRKLLGFIPRLSPGVFTSVIIAGALAISQIVLFITYSSVGADQLNEGVSVSATATVNGVFPVSQLFFVAVGAFIAFFLLSKNTLLNVKQRNAAILSILPLTILAIALYVFQMVTAGITTYYLPKSLGLALIPLGMFAAVGFAFYSHDIVKSYFKLGFIGTAAIGLSILGVAIIGTNQSFYGTSRLLSSNSRVSESTAGAVVDYLRYGIKSNTDVIVFRDNPEKPYEDVNGKFESKVVYEKYTCAFKVIQNGHLIDMKLDRLKECAKKIAPKGKSIVVITSDRTKQFVKDLHQSNIQIVNVKDD